MSFNQTEYLIGLWSEALKEKKGIDIVVDLEERIMMRSRQDFGPERLIEFDRRYFRVIMHFGDERVVYR